MPLLQDFLQYSPLVSRQELDQSLSNLFLVRESVEARFPLDLLQFETIRAAWFLLLARYAQADSLNIQAQNINKARAKSTLSTTLAMDTETSLQTVVLEAKKLSGFNVCIVEDSIHAFPLAERLFASLGATLRTAIVATTQHSIQLLEQLPSCHIVVRHDLEKLSIWVDPRLCSAIGDSGLPHRLLSQLEFVAHQLVHNDSSFPVVGTLDYLSPADKLDAALNDPPAKPYVSELLHEVIASFAKSRPEDPAICAWDADLTYQELDRLSTRLAYQLVGAGVGIGTLVPLFFEKSAYAHVTQIAVLKAGGAFTTLPADMPLERIKSIVAQLRPDDADQPPLGLCSPSLANILTPLVSRVIPVDENSVAEIVDDFQANRLRPQPQPHDLAYVIFTSGTTGVPKGVMVEHRNICSTCRYIGGAMAYGEPGVREAQFLSYAFDASLHEIFYTLFNGGCLCILSEDERMNDIAGAMTRMGVTHAKLTPSIVDQFSPEDFPTLQKLYLGGELLSGACVDRWRPHVEEVWNNYGPAECAVQSSIISCSDPRWASGVVGNTGSARCFIVDPRNPNRRMPRGFIGEILIEGPNVSRGYLRNPTQTDRAFLQGLTWAPSRRFYRTGDMGYVDAYGLLTCKGRNDDQVKINGQRIECGEVETQLLSVLPAASRAVVDAVSPSGRGKVLVAFIQLDDSLTSLLPFDQVESRVRDQLVNVLPPAFIPSRMLQVHEIPMGATGKTDRKALRKLASEMLSESPKALQEQQSSKADVNVASLQPAEVSVREELLRKMWAETLQLPIEELDSSSHFFLSGGSSLLAMRLAALARKQSWDLNVKKVFAHPVLSDMAGAIILLSSSGSSVPQASFQTPLQLKNLISQDWEIEVDAIEDIYPASAIQENLLVLATTNNGAYIMQYTFDIPDDVNLEKLKASWRRVVEAHPILRTRFYHTATGLSQVVLKKDFHWVQEGIDSIDARQKIKSTLLLPNQSLSQFHLLNDGNPNSRTLVWTVSHALTDGWTSSRLFAEVHAVYTRDYTAPPAEPYTSFVQSLTLEPEEMDSFWKQELDHGPVIEYPILPYSQFRPNTNAKLSSRLAISSAQTKSRYSVALMVRAAWAITISELTQQDDVLFGLNLSGRHDCPQVVGPTVTTVPLRTSVCKSLTVSEFLELMHKQSVRMMPYEQTGMRRIGNIEGGSLRPYCKFQNSLVIQLPREDVAGTLDGALNSEMRWMNPTQLDTVSAHGLVVNCLIESSAVEVWMNYDDRVLSEAGTQDAMTLFLAILAQVLTSEKEKTISQVCAKLRSTNPTTIALTHSSAHPATHCIQRGRVIKYLGRAVDASRIEDEMANILGINNKELYVSLIRPSEKVTSALLAAFITTDDLEAFARYVAELQSQMGKVFPTYMIPELYIPLSTAEASSTSQEKLEIIAWNYNSLSTTLSKSNKKSDGSLDGPPTGLSPVEQILMKCWSQVLDRTDITLSDNFLLLGGDSIKVMRLVSTARAANLRLSVTSALQNPIFRRMAAVAEITESKVVQDVPCWSLVGGKEALIGAADHIKQQGGYELDDLEDIFPVTSYQGSTFLDSLRTPGTCVMKALYRLSPEFDFARFQRAWEQVCEHFPNLRTRVIQPNGWDLLQAICPKSTAPNVLHFATINDLQLHVDGLAASMTRLGASLNEMILAQVGPEEQQERYLIWALHHVLFDGSTLAKIRKAIIQAYHGDIIPYQPVALREYIGFLRGQDSAMQSKFWRRYLKGAEVATFPHYPTPDYVVRPRQLHHVDLTLKRPGAQSITMATMMHAVWGMVLTSFTRTRDATYQHLLSGRTAAADKIDRFVGPTITLVPVRVKVQERLNSTVHGFLAELQAHMTEMTPYTVAGMQKISSFVPEKSSRLFDFHHMLVIHNANDVETKAEKDIPMYECENSMNLDGYLGFVLQCFITPSGVRLTLRWDEVLISHSLIDIICARVSFLLREMVEGDQSLTVRSLWDNCISL